MSATMMLARTRPLKRMVVRTTPKASGAPTRTDRIAMPPATSRLLSAAVSNARLPAKAA